MHLHHAVEESPEMVLSWQLAQHTLSLQGPAPSLLNVHQYIACQSVDVHSPGAACALQGQAVWISTASWQQA